MFEDTSVAPVGAELVAAIGGLFIPFVVNMVKGQTWSEPLRVAVAYAFTAVWTFLAFYLTEELLFSEPFELRDVIMMTFATFFVAHATFKIFWKDHTSNFTARGARK